MRSISANKVKFSIHFSFFSKGKVGCQRTEAFASEFYLRFFLASKLLFSVWNYFCCFGGCERLIFFVFIVEAARISCYLVNGILCDEHFGDVKPKNKSEKPCCYGGSFLGW